MKYVVIMFIISFLGCGSDPELVPEPVASPSPVVGPQGEPGQSCYITKIEKKCYLKCPDGSWAYLGKECGHDS